jgi:hypothetical protein
MARFGTPPQPPGPPPLPDLQAAAAALSEQFAQGMVAAVVRMAVQTHDALERWSNWSLIVTGATTGLVVSNLGDLGDLLGPKGRMLMVAGLGTSALCGLAQRVAGYRFSIGRLALEAAPGILQPLFTEHSRADDAIQAGARAHGLPEPLPTMPDPRAVEDRIVVLFPWTARWYLRRRFRRGLQDPLADTRELLRHQGRQAFWTGLQVVALVFSLTAAAVIALSP